MVGMALPGTAALPIASPPVQPAAPAAPSSAPASWQEALFGQGALASNAAAHAAGEAGNYGAALGLGVRAFGQGAGTLVAQPIVGAARGVINAGSSFLGGLAGDTGIASAQAAPAAGATPSQGGAPAVPGTVAHAAAAATAGAPVQPLAGGMYGPPSEQQAAAAVTPEQIARAFQAPNTDPGARPAGVIPNWAQPAGAAVPTIGQARAQMALRAQQLANSKAAQGFGVDQAALGAASSLIADRRAAAGTDAEKLRAVSQFALDKFLLLGGKNSAVQTDQLYGGGMGG